jgi:hypothetical protein
VKDLFLYKEGYRITPILAVTAIGFIYKILKSHLSEKLVLNDESLYLLVETLFIGYNNQIDNFVKIFDLTHKDNLVSKIQKLGLKFVVHFYSLVAMNDANQKLHDYMNYELVFGKKNRTIMKNFYVSKDGLRMTLLFKPLAGILLAIEDKNQFDTLASCLLVLKHKIEIFNQKEQEKLIMPEEFVHKIIRLLSSVITKLKKEQHVTSNQDLELAEYYMRAYVYTKLLES